jgi:tRNA G10  N-methylase Trm11
VTPFAPTGPTVYRPVVGALHERLQRIVPHLVQLEDVGPGGSSYLADFRSLQLDEPVDAVITSPPFSKSVRFWSSNWMRLWFAGWSPDDFKQEPNRFLEVEQRKHFEAYREFAKSMAGLLKPGGLLVMHLGETATVNMATSIQPMLEPYFEVAFAGRESVTDTESHGLTDKGATVAHWYVFATARP